MPLKHQAEFLRVLEDREFTKIGGGKTLKMEAQLIATTNKDLWEASREGEFLQPLLERFAEPITIPPLRDRRDDIPVIVQGALRGEEELRQLVLFDDTVIGILKGPRYRWPGNIRQLLRVLRGIAASEDRSVDVRKIADVQEELSRRSSPVAEQHGASGEESDLCETDKGILACLRKEPLLGWRDIHERLNGQGLRVNQHKLKAHLRKMREQGFIHKVGRSRNTKYRAGVPGAA